MREVNQAGMDIIRGFEGLRFEAYLDQANVPTIGYGHIKGVKMGDTCTRDQAEAWLREDLAIAIHDVEDLVHVPLNDNEFAALVSFQFNCGGLTYHDQPSTMRKRLNAGLREEAAMEFLKWTHAGGHISRGLARRRDAEKALFLKPSPS